jgi:hypothetical protein
VDVDGKQNKKKSNANSKRMLTYNIMNSFRGTYRLYLQSSRVGQERKQNTPGSKQIFAEDGADISLWKITSLSTDYTALFLRM